MKRIYIAAPLFSEADRDYNTKIAKKIAELVYEYYLPQENSSINDKSNCANSITIYHGDTEELKKADILVCLLDGTVIDPGVAAEVGWVAGWNESLDNCSAFLSDEKKRIIGLLTDSRDGTHTPPHSSALLNKMKLLNEEIGESQFSYTNLYVIGAVKKYGKLVSSIEDLVLILKDELTRN